MVAGRVLICVFASLFDAKKRRKCFANAPALFIDSEEL